MSCLGLIVVLSGLGQVPPPTLGPGAAPRTGSGKAVNTDERGGPARGLGRAIGPRRGSSGRPTDSRALPRPVDPDGPTRFVPLPDVVLPVPSKRRDSRGERA